MGAPDLRQQRLQVKPILRTHLQLSPCQTDFDADLFAAPRPMGFLLAADTSRHPNGGGESASRALLRDS